MVDVKKVESLSKPITQCWWPSDEFNHNACAGQTDRPTRLHGIQRAYALYMRRAVEKSNLTSTRNTTYIAFELQSKVRAY